MKNTILIVSMFLITIIAHGQVTNGLVAKYSFNGGNANDEVGTNHGTVNGANLTADRFGNLDKAYSCVGGSYIALPDAAALKSTSMTVSFWVKVAGYEVSNVNSNYIYTIVNSTTNAYFAAFSFSVTPSDGTYFSVAQNGPGESTYGSSANSNTSTWQHYVLSSDNDSLKMYIDGQQEWSYYKGYATVFTSDSIYIGISGNTTFNGNFNGSIDDIRVYDRVLTPIEVDSLFNEENPLLGIEELNVANEVAAVYPNPTNGLITAEINPLVVGSKYIIVNIFGQTVMAGKFVSEKTTINIKNLTEGIYFLQIVGQNQRTVKFVKE